MQMGAHAAANMARALARRAARAVPLPRQGLARDDRPPARPSPIGGLRLSGLVAWLAWLGVHIFFLIGFRNRLLVLFNWAWAYLTYDRGARLITGEGRDP